MFYRDVLIESRERNAFMSKELQIRNSTVDFLFLHEMQEKTE